MMADVLGFADPVRPTRSRVRKAAGRGIGAGVSGLLAALRPAGLGAAVAVLEKNDDVGGTWLENRYPGAGVDTPSHLYSVSFFDRSWSTYFGRRDEVEGYLRDFADAHRLRPLIRFSTEVLAATWADDRQEWTLDLSTGDRWSPTSWSAPSGS